MAQHLISSKDMAHFVASGYLKYEDMVPKDLCSASAFCGALNIDRRKWRAKGVGTSQA